MALFKDDPLIEQWFRDLFADLVETYPGMAGGKARMPKYWHSLCGFKPEALKRAFIRATEICEYFPSVPKILEIQAQGFGSQPYKRSRESYNDDRGPYPPSGSEAHKISVQVYKSILQAMSDGKGKSPEEQERLWVECRAFQAEMRPKYQTAMVNINPDTGKEYKDKVPF